MVVCLCRTTFSPGDTLVLRNGLGGYAGTEDTVIRQDAPDNNSGGSTAADINGPSPTPALLKFKGLDILQGNYASIDSVTLTLTQWNIGTRPSQPFSVDILQISDANAAWTQGNQDNQPANTSSATWNNLAHGATVPVPWVGGPGLTGLGGTIGQIASFPLIPQTGSPQYAIDLDPAAIVHWIEGASNNAGMYLHQPSPVDAWWGFLTSESSNSQLRPTLTIEYTPVPKPASGRLQFGWWDSFGYASPSQIGSQGANFAVAYNAGYTSADVEAWLNFAGANGLEVTAGITQTLVDARNTTAIRNFVREFNSHPAVTGWFIYDEPSQSRYSVCKAAYDAIKLESSKPVSIVFGSQAPFNGNLSRFADAYDFLLIDSYPCMAGQQEFNTTSFNSFKATMSSTGTQASVLGKEWGAVLQAFGREPDSESWRLPTFNEARFMAYYAINQGASTVVFYPLYRTNIAPVVPVDAYPHGGTQWQGDVFAPLAGEMELLGLAIGAGAIGGNLVSDNFSNIQTSLFQDPGTGDYYLLALNAMSGFETVEFTLNIPGFSDAQPLFENSLRTIPITDGTFMDSFDHYQVHVYRLMVPEPSVMMLLYVGSARLLLTRRSVKYRNRETE